MKNKGLSDELIIQALKSHKTNSSLLMADAFDDYFVDRAKQLIDRIEVATGKSISGRDSEETIREFGESLSK